jgi:hypothetical protein
MRIVIFLTRYLFNFQLIIDSTDSVMSHESNECLQGKKKNQHMIFNPSFKLFPVVFLFHNKIDIFL